MFPEKAGVRRTEYMIFLQWEAVSKSSSNCTGQVLVSSLADGHRKYSSDSRSPGPAQAQAIVAQRSRNRAIVRAAAPTLAMWLKWQLVRDGIRRCGRGGGGECQTGGLALPKVTPLQSPEGTDRSSTTKPTLVAATILPPKAVSLLPRFPFSLDST